MTGSRGSSGRAGIVALDLTAAGAPVPIHTVAVVAGEAEELSVSADLNALPVDDVVVVDAGAGSIDLPEMPTTIAGHTVLALDVPVYGLAAQDLRAVPSC